MTNPIRIGTRKSELALWQANHALDLLTAQNCDAEIKPIVSPGDIVLDKPLYALGITGVFTRTLDVALLAGEIDVAVHSFKDVPTLLPKGLVKAAVLKRANARDILVHKGDTDFSTQDEFVIATGSLRRHAAWLHKYPQHKLVGLRGNVNSRLKKLKDNPWAGAIFAAAGLERINLLSENCQVLDWMVPAPAQGAIMIMCREDDVKTLEMCRQLNDENTDICTQIEREFLNKLEGGCTAPIGAYARIKDGNVHFEGVLYSRDGQTKIGVSRMIPLGRHSQIAYECVQEIFAKGGRAVMQENARRAQQDQKTAALAQQIHVLSTKKLSPQYPQNLNSKCAYTEANFIDIEFCKSVPEHAKTDGVIFTSQNALKAVHKNLSHDDYPTGSIFCVGEKTKALAEQLFGRVTHMENSASALAKHLVAHHKNMKFTFYCGDQRLDDLPNYLLKKQIHCREVVVYNTHYKSMSISGKIDCVLFFSPTAVKSFIMENDPQPIAFCIGNTTAEEAKKYFKHVEIAASPNVENVIELVNKYYE